MSWLSILAQAPGSRRRRNFALGPPAPEPELLSYTVYYSKVRFPGFTGDVDDGNKTVDPAGYVDISGYTITIDLSESCQVDYVRVWYSDDAASAVGHPDAVRVLVNSTAYEVTDFSGEVEEADPIYYVDIPVDDTDRYLTFGFDKGSDPAPNNRVMIYQIEVWGYALGFDAGSHFCLVPYDDVPIVPHDGTFGAILNDGTKIGAQTGARGWLDKDGTMVTLDFQDATTWKVDYADIWYHDDGTAGVSAPESLYISMDGNGHNADLGAAIFAGAGEWGDIYVARATLNETDDEGNFGFTQSGNWTMIWDIELWGTQPS